MRTDIPVDGRLALVNANDGHRHIGPGVETLQADRKKNEKLQQGGKERTLLLMSTTFLKDLVKNQYLILLQYFENLQNM